MVKLLYAHVGLKDVSPGLHCLHSIQKLTPWSLTPEIRADKWRWRRTKQVRTRNLKGRNTLPFISGESLTSKTREEACDHRNNPATGAALFYHKRGLHQPHVAIHAAASLAGELLQKWEAWLWSLRLFAKVKKMGVRGRVRLSESYLILSCVKQNFRSFLKIYTSGSVAKLSTASSDPSQPWK